MKESSGPGGPESMAAWLRRQLTRRGYDISGPRSGGRAAFARDSGISASTVGRLLRGDPVTDVRVLARLAATLDTPLGDILVRAGVLTEDDLRAVQDSAHGPRRITPEQAADELGLIDDQPRRLFISLTHTLQRQPPTEGAADN